MNKKYMAIIAGLLAFMVTNAASAKTLPVTGSSANKNANGSSSSPASAVSTFDPTVVSNSTPVAGTGSSANNGSTTVTPPVVSQPATGTKSVQGLPPVQVTKGNYPGVSASGS